MYELQENLATLHILFLCLLPGLILGCYKFPADVADPCQTIECQYGAECRPSADGAAGQCHCPGRCPTYGDSRGSRPVCGTDGEDYPNVCELRRAACSLQTDITVKFQGRCGLQNAPGLDARCEQHQKCFPYPCEGVECPASQVCQLDPRRRPVCRCNAVCAPDFRPVCGSDGRTYVNECALRVEACKSRRGLRIIFAGECGAGASPCENLQCGPGQECDIDRYGIAACQCPQACEPVVRPVCGDDGKTYHSECDMRRTGCLEQKVINLEHRGACGAQGTCFDYPCPREAICLMENRQPICRCPVCAEVYDPVCGNDGRSYTSECSLRKEACEQNKEIKVSYEGLCSGCEHKHCEYYAACESDSSGVGRCVCPKDCIKVESPVCGTDGVTYQNECEMRVAACEKEQYIMVGSRGPCDLCQNVHCMHGARCERGRCVCQFDCPDDYDPVCGSDGSTYRNDCEMRRGACTKSIHLSTVFYGECDRTLSAREDHANIGLPILTCQPGECRFGGICEHDYRGFAHCVCNFRCSPVSDESICGSDGRFYDSECKLREEACRLQQNIHVASNEVCGAGSCRCHRLGSWTESCDNGQCECRPGVGGPRCDRCEPGYWGLHKIASDGNLGCLPCECHALGSARDDCEQTSGRCACRHGVRGDKCDACSDSMIFAQDGTCIHESLSQTFAGPCGPLSCKFGSTCREVGDRFSCSCIQRCPPVGWLPVCGTDGVTYASPCFLELFSCRQQKQINIAKEGSCKPGDIAVGGEEVSPTAGPVRRSTVQKTTWDQYEPKSTRDVGHSEHLYLSTGPTTSGPPVDDTPVEIPAFSGISFLELPRLQAYTRLSLELEFRSFGGDGILLYNGQTATGAGDFVSLAVRDGYVEFRYDLGSGPVILRSPQRLQEGRFHRLVAKRYLRDGVLTLDGQKDVSGHSEGALKSLDLAENMFLGYVPPADENKGIFENIGTSDGLVGCIRRLRVGHRDVNLSYPISNDLIRGRNIRECRGQPCNSTPCRNGGSCVPGDPDTFQCVCSDGFSGPLCQMSDDPCANSPCTNGATCVSLPDHEFTCACEQGYSGRFCEHSLTKPLTMSEVFVPEFDGSTFLELPTLSNAGQELVLELWFLSLSIDGVLLYNGQESLGRGDFVCLNIVNGYVHFLYDLGSGVANITSLTPITLGRWHVVRASRVGRKGSLQIDDGELATGESKGPLSELNLDRSLYVGGYRHLSAVNPESGITDPFRGALQRLFINNELLEFRKAAQASQNVKPFRGLPCGPNPCSNGGLCVPQLNNFHCKCATGYGGLWCDKYVANISVDESVLFDGKTFLKFPEKLLRSDTHSRIEVTFKLEMDIPTQGLLLLRKHENTLLGASAVLAVALVDGYLEVGLSDEKNALMSIQHSAKRLDDGKWHTAVFDRHNDYAMLQVDETTITAWTPITEAEGHLWIGGCSTIPPGLPATYYFGFIGCLHAVIVDDEALKITGQPCT